MGKQMDLLILKVFRAWASPARLAPSDCAGALARGRDVAMSFISVTLIATLYLGARLLLDRPLPMPAGVWIVVYGVSLYLHLWYLVSLVRAALLLRELRSQS